MTRGSQLLSSPWHHARKPDKHVPSASPGYGSEKDLILNFFAGRHNANPGDEDEEESL